MKKILFITWTFSMGGGAEKMLSTLVNHLDEEKFEIDILEIGRFGTNLEKIKDNVRILKPMLNPIKDSKLVHYFKWQLSYSLNPAVLLKYIFQRKLRKSKIAKEIEKAV